MGVPCPRREEHLITVLIADGEQLVHLNTQECFRIRTSADRLSALRLRALKGEAKFDQIRLRRRDSRASLLPLREAL